MGAQTSANEVVAMQGDLFSNFTKAFRLKGETQDQVDRRVREAFNELYETKQHQLLNQIASAGAAYGRSPQFDFLLEGKAARLERWETEEPTAEIQRKPSGWTSTSTWTRKKEAPPAEWEIKCNNAIEPFTQQDVADIPAGERMTFEYAGRFDCVSRPHLLESWRSFDESYVVWGNCTFDSKYHTPISNTCERFYKLPLGGGTFYVSDFSVKRIEQNPKIRHWSMVQSKHPVVLGTVWSDRFTEYLYALAPYALPGTR